MRFDARRPDVNHQSVRQWSEPAVSPHAVDANGVAGIELLYLLRTRPPVRPAQGIVDSAVHRIEWRFDAPDCEQAEFRPGYPIHALLCFHIARTTIPARGI